MSNGFLSQEEIDSLLNGGGGEQAPMEVERLSDLEKDLLGEVGNISMGSAATALSTIVGQKVNITTPTISITTMEVLKSTFETPNVLLDVKFTSGISGGNLLIMKITDAAVIANLMMGGNGEVESRLELSELEISAVQEAMNQMIGSAATSMATMFNREVNISPPHSAIIDETTTPVSEDIDEHDEIIAISFKMTIGTLIDSNILQILPLNTGKKIVSIMMGTEDQESTAPTQPDVNHNSITSDMMNSDYNTEVAYTHKGPEINQNPVQVKQAAFQTLNEVAVNNMPKNIDLILDVPLDVSVELGRTKKNIRDILALSAGSLIELNKLAEEPVDIYINGKKIAYGEVVVIDENFGVKITGIISGEERIRTLSK
ncbi:flagellar motor switch phosphatase FliY [Clostridium sp. UBA4548]|uniref:flagellar motor switch phosphatase FliY n=1 Tax=Clostridium sp. UBA4548 TaxID=1946361 RepID=UPI0025BA1F40|nr:flagellar motor switch phosphatase FliY [Clostridium sp. UBA4548]